MASILILYASTDGQTLKIADRLQQVIQEGRHHVAVVPVGEASTVDLATFDMIVIGASIRYGKHATKVVNFIQRNTELLASRDNAFFSVNMVARKPGKNQPATNPHLVKFLCRLAWRPRRLAVFAGKLDYPRYGFFDRTMIRLIMWMTGGPTDPTAVVEFTDWQRVEAFGRLIRDNEQASADPDGQLPHR